MSRTRLFLSISLGFLLIACGTKATPDPRTISAVVEGTLTAMPQPTSQIAEEEQGSEQEVSATQEVTQPGSEKDGMQMVHVPAGEFIMGSLESEGWEDERPQHTVYLDSFLIDKTEVTTAQYDRCVQAGACSLPDTKGYACTYGAPNKQDHPINCVDWSQAEAYCSWVGRRLPTEAEWEKAARGTDGRIYPWGNQMPSAALANFDLKAEDTTPVGQYPSGASPYGALDMAGNVWEWVADWYDDQYYAQSTNEDPVGPSSGTYRVVRGGSWDDAAPDIRVAYRSGYEPTPSTGRHDDLGFRCAR